MLHFATSPLDSYLFVFTCSLVESIILSGDERDHELGKVCVHMRYEEAVEQVWITLVKVRFHPTGALQVNNKPFCLIYTLAELSFCV